VGRKQAYRNDNQIFVSWETSGADVPSICENTHNMWGGDEYPAYEGDVGQAFAMRLRNKIAGYKANITDNNSIIVMGLNSAVLGRLAITYYRELNGLDFFDRLETWHTNFAWFQDYGNNPKDFKEKLRFFGAPAPQDIAWATYGKSVEGKNGKKLMNAVVERIVPCIIDNMPFPKDLISAIVYRTGNRIGMEHWQWEKCLGIACALYKGTHKEENYSMELDENRDSRDYVYGRLLALADMIESMALSIAKENRDTNAARLMQRFSDRPYSTWQILEEGLKPYLDRIYVNYPGLWRGYKDLLDDVETKFKTIESATSDIPRLTGEYLLGYHCQRQWFKTHKRKDGAWILKE
jgi:CRISPR-associated protein Csd1